VDEETKKQGYSDGDNQSVETATAPEHSPSLQQEIPKAGPQNVSPVPNSGLQAWLHVVGGFVLFFNTWDILKAFGVFQTYYESGALFTESSSNISWIGAIQSIMLLTVGFVSGPFYDRGHLRILLIVAVLALCLDT